MMTKKEFIEQINGREYPFGLTREEVEYCKLNQIVVVYGASDDLLEFEGAFRDEMDAYGKTTAAITQGGVLKNECECEDCPYAIKMFNENKNKIILEWDVDGYSWVVRTDIPHETFEIVEDGDKYCLGAVIDLADLF